MNTRETPGNVCSSLAVTRQRVHDSYPPKPTMRNCLIARQRFRNHGYIDGVGYKRKATDNFAAEARKQDNELGLGLQKNTRGQPVKN
jgi:hypothetical protein